MKNLLLVVLVIVMASCGQHKKEIARMQAIQDSIAQIGVQKDNSILGFIGEMNEIQMNLDSIKTLEKIVSVNTAGGGEIKADAKRRILEDIASIHDLLNKNKELVKSLQAKLRTSNLKVTELENMIALLTKSVEEKDGEIAVLNQELNRLKINISGLNQKIEKITAESEKTIQEKTQVISDQTIAMNTAFYAFGTAKELAENNVIEKEGGVLGLGKTIKMKKDFNKDYFMKIDIREFKKLALNSKKAKVITYHPADSYKITGEKTVEELIIENQTEFWKASKYLLVVVD